jgi:hypothetical protein
MDKVLTLDGLSIGHGLGGREDVTPSDQASGPTGESASLFVSPSSLGTGSIGGDKFGGGVRALISVEDPKSLCGGVIANSFGRRFCIKTSCTVKSHWTQKTLLKASTLHVQGQNNKATYIWAVLQCHWVMQKFILLNFWGHPLVVKEMSLFMLTERVDPSEMEALAGRVKKAEDAANKATAALERTDKAFTTLKRNYDDLMEDVKWLKKSTK